MQKRKLKISFNRKLQITVCLKTTTSSLSHQCECNYIVRKKIHGGGGGSDSDGETKRKKHYGA